ncbi:MAG: type III-B CRISPR module RAMP protein Cmr1 [Firmicutes bacterium]|nr:type III-B CRISPR module RAMP protein Cmr1 [Bacillota bacterium]
MGKSGKPRRETFKCEILTPMFCGGADPQKAELRASSVKGVLRFWWRALHGHLPLSELRKQEGQIFGSTEGIGKSKVLLSVEADLQPCTDPFPKHNIRVTSKSKTFPVNILDYLCYGTYTWNREKRTNEFVKSYLKQGEWFKLHIVYPDTCEKQILDALYMLVNFGGLGACSRNGFGSAHINDPRLSIEPVNFLKQLNSPASPVDYSALSSGLRLFRTRKLHGTWDSALAELGIAYRVARGSLEPKHEFKRRKYVASPLIAEKKTHSDIARRAKPYFMHVARVGDEFEGRILYLPAAFCAGLSKDSKNNIIDQNKHNEMNKEFASVCADMNNQLADKLEVVL